VSTDLPWTVGRLLEWTTGHLQKKGVESARLEVQLLLAHALGCSRTELYMRHDQEPAEAHRVRFRELVQQRIKGSPVAYLLGRKEFFSLEFEVNPAVLIPRPDTEWLVTECLRLARALPEPAVLDVGTGSGCLAVAVAHRHKAARVRAVDVSADALAVARRNAERHGVAGRIEFLQGDLFGPVGPGALFDFILSNPPYIRRADLAGLSADVREHEPMLALDGGPDGFAVLDRLIDGAPDHLAPGGYLIVEIGFGQEAEARSRFERRGYELAPTVRDLGGVPRVLAGRRPAAP
jgi:release factor glutamine methyltransferase